MTPDKINRTIAEWMGWKWYRRPVTGPWAKKPMRSLYHPELMKPLELELADMTERECNYVFMEREGMIPNFYHDLNACREAVNNLSPMDRQLFLTKICKHTPEKRRWIPVVIVEVLTDPRLICEYLLRTIGRWEEK